MTADAAPPEADVDADVARLLQSLQQCRHELAELRRAQEVREEHLAPLELARRQLDDLSGVLDRHLTRSERRAARPRRTLFGPRGDTGGPKPSEAEDLARIRASVLFDGAWYLQQYPKVVRTGLSPALHYVRHGAVQRKDPGPHFAVSAYLRDNPGLPRSTNPLLHYLDNVPGVAT